MASVIHFLSSGQKLIYYSGLFLVFNNRKPLLASPQSTRPAGGERYDNASLLTSKKSREFLALSLTKFLIKGGFEMRNSLTHHPTSVTLSASKLYDFTSNLNTDYLAVLNEAHKSRCNYCAFSSIYRIRLFLRSKFLLLQV